MLNKKRQRDEWFEKQLNPKKRVLESGKRWGRYRYLFNNKDVTPLETAIKWFLRLKGYDRLITCDEDKHELFALDNLTDMILKNEVKGYQPLLGEGEPL